MMKTKDDYIEITDNQGNPVVRLHPKDNPLDEIPLKERERQFKTQYTLEQTSINEEIKGLADEYLSATGARAYLVKNVDGRMIFDKYTDDFCLWMVRNLLTTRKTIEILNEVLESLSRNIPW